MALYSSRVFYRIKIYAYIFFYVSDKVPLLCIRARLNTRILNTFISLRCLEENVKIKGPQNYYTDDLTSRLNSCLTEAIHTLKGGKSIYSCNRQLSKHVRHYYTYILYCIIWHYVYERLVSISRSNIFS